MRHTKNTDIILKSIQILQEHFEILPTIKDTSLAIRVVGEFSSGKTRVIREIFEDLIPKNLYPISSQEVQTRIPLEITFNKKVALHLVKGSFGDQNRKIIKELVEFPKREELSNYNPEEYNLCLSLPEYRLTLAHGDGQSTEAMRFCVIDTPG